MKLATDVHVASIVAVRMLDGAKPQSRQTFKPADRSRAFKDWWRRRAAFCRTAVEGNEAEEMNHRAEAAK